MLYFSPSSLLYNKVSNTYKTYFFYITIQLITLTKKPSQSFYNSIYVLCACQPLKYSIPEEISFTKKDY